MRKIPLEALRSLGRRGFCHSESGGGAAFCRRIYGSTWNGGMIYSGSKFVGPSTPCSHHNLSLILNGTINPRCLSLRQFSSMNERDDIALEEEVEKKAGWLLKLIFIGTASLVAFEFFPYMGDNLLQQSMSLLHVKDPLFKRMGASRLASFAVDDERRMKVIEMGGAEELLNMLEAAKDDKTRKEALKALVAISKCDEAAEALHRAGANAIVISIPNSLELAEVETYKSTLLKKFEELDHHRNILAQTGGAQISLE